MPPLGPLLVAALLLLPPALTHAEVRIQTYELPKGGGHPHDVAVGDDGIVWYTAQRDGKLGRLDPVSGKVELIPLGRGARPEEAAGAIFFLCSPWSNFVQGQVLTVNGGQMTGMT